MLRILFICYGNICRSTMAQSVLAFMARKRDLREFFQIDSAATHRDEIGNPPHRGTLQKLREVHIPSVPHRARLLTRADGESFDYIIGMDAGNLRDMRRILGDCRAELALLLDYTDRPRDIADPWFTGNFDETYDDIVCGLNGFLEYLREKGEIPHA